MIRAWAFNDDVAKAGDSAIQLKPLEYDEVSLRALDLVLARAQAYGVKLLMPLGGYWSLAPGHLVGTGEEGFEMPSDGVDPFLRLTACAASGS